MYFSHNNAHSNHFLQYKSACKTDLFGHTKILLDVKAGQMLATDMYHHLLQLLVGLAPSFCLPSLANSPLVSSLNNHLKFGTDAPLPP